MTMKIPQQKKIKKLPHSSNVTDNIDFIIVDDFNLIENIKVVLPRRFY